MRPVRLQGASSPRIPLRLLYLGSFLDAEIVAERGLRSHNAAGSNRMLRLSHAMRRAGLRPIVLSPATSLRAVRKGGPLVHPGRVRRHGGMAVVYAPAMNVIGLNALTSLLFQIAVLLRILRRPLSSAVVYNFSAGFAILTAWLAAKPGLRVINNVEDVSVPSLSDWSSRTEARPVQQLIFWVCMNIVARLSDVLLVPTRRFLPYLPSKPAEVVTGCIEVPSDNGVISPPPVRVLFAGKIEREHGIVDFVEALQQLDGTPVAKALRVDVSGAGPMAEWAKEQLAALTSLSAQFHGFVTVDEYRDLLDRAHVCVALQDPEGRYSDFKTPSKIYEFLGHGKALITTEVGDVRALPASTLVVLQQLSAAAIAGELSRFVDDPSRVTELQANAYKHASVAFSYDFVGHRLRHLLIGDVT